MYKIGGTDADTFIMKFTLVGSFVVVTITFVGKIALLVMEGMKMKLLELKEWVTSPDVAKDIGSFLWEAIKEGAGGLF